MHGIFGERERARNDCICTSQPSMHAACAEVRHPDACAVVHVKNKFEMISDKKKRVTKPRMRTYTTYAVIEKSHRLDH